MSSPASPEVPTTAFADGSPIPLIGFGTGGAQGPAGVEVIVSALRTGYRLLDTAAQYGNRRPWVRPCAAAAWIPPRCS